VAVGDGDQGMRVAAAAYLKNFTRRNLESSLSSSEHYKEFRDQLAQALLRVEPAIFRVLIEVVSLILLYPSRALWLQPCFVSFSVVLLTAYNIC
jgi:hypothetical protein